MKDQLISFKTAKLAKEKGFDWNTVYHWSTHDDKGILNNFLRVEDYISRNYNNYKFAYISNKLEKLYAAPIQSLLQKQLREVHKINIVIKPNFNCYNIEQICIYNEFSDENENIDLKGLEFNDFEKYEEALEKGLQEALKLIKN